VHVPDLPPLVELPHDPPLFVCIESKVVVGRGPTQPYGLKPE
jgi:hypothetical protein